MLFFSSTNPIPVDAPFTRMLAGRSDLPFAFGVPPISDSSLTQSAPELSQAAQILGLDSDDPEFVGRRVRHLAQILRSSRFADRINWRSYLAQLDSAAPIFDEPDRLTVESISPSLTYTLLKTSEQDPHRNFWRVSVDGTYPSLSFSVNGLLVAQFSSTLANTAVGTSGYSLGFKCSAGTGDEISLVGYIRTPYSGDCMPIYNAIKSKPDLVSRLTYNNSEYADTIAQGIAVEDAIAAFILAVNEL